MDTLFGPENMALKFFLAFATVLVLIFLTAWLVRRFGADRLGGASARGRQPRLAVIDAATVDARRRLVLIRRDNVEHLMMIGGPTDVVVEQNIVRGAPATPRAPETSTRTTDVAMRQAPAADNGFPLQPVSEQAPLPPPRPYRAPATEEPWHAPEPGARPRPASTENSLSGLAAELSSRIAPPDFKQPTPVRSEPPRAAATQMTPPPQPVAPPVAPPVATFDHEPGEAPQTDQNLADMAQQLEAALRRGPAESRAPVTDPLAVPAAQPRPVEMPRREYKLRVDPRIEAPPAVKPADESWSDPSFDTARTEPRIDTPRLDMPRAEPRIETPRGRTEPRTASRPASPAGNSAPGNNAPGSSVYDSLEQEMASLLGRPPGKT